LVHNENDPAMNGLRKGPGRPPKFGRPSRPITVTLPDDVVERLVGIDPDLGRAIVTAVERPPRLRARVGRSAELASYGSRAVIVVTPIKALKRLRGVQLVPVGTGRALISLDHPHLVANLELDIRDALDRGGVNPTERRTLESIAAILQDARRSRKVGISARTIIVLESKRRHQAS
jgi:hypothetical protein